MNWFKNDGLSSIAIRSCANAYDSFEFCASCKMNWFKSSTLSSWKSRFAQPFGWNWIRGCGRDGNLKRDLDLVSTQRNANHCFLWSLRKFAISLQQKRPHRPVLIFAYLPQAMHTHCLHGFGMFSSPPSTLVRRRQVGQMPR